jgi:hypothetical protein
LECQILRLNGVVNPYSQVKWIFSTKMAQHKALVLFKLNSHAKMAPDTGRRGSPPAVTGIGGSFPGLPAEVLFDPVHERNEPVLIAHALRQAVCPR